MVLYLLFLLIFFPSTHSPPAPFAFSCWRRGTAPRWMRSAYLFHRPSVNTPAACSPPVGVGAPDDPQRALSADLPFTYQLPLRTFAFSCWRRGTAERWMRSAYLFHRPSVNISTFAPPTRRGRRPRRPATPSLRRPSVNIPAVRSLCLLLLEKGDRGAVDEE